MSRAIATRVDNYTSPLVWGEGKNGQPRTMFNYGDGLVAVLVPGRKGEAKSEVYRFRYCINGRPSSLHIGNGGPENFEKARQFSDSENDKVKLNRAQNFSLENRALLIGKKQKTKKKKTIDNGFKDRNELMKFMSHLNSQIPHNVIALLTILHISSLLELWQLLELKYEDVYWDGNELCVSISLDNRQKKAKYVIKPSAFSRKFFTLFLNNKTLENHDDHIFGELKKTSTGEFQALIGMEILKAGITYPVEISSLQNVFINEFSEFGLIDKNVLVKFFGFKYQLVGMQIRNDGLGYSYHTKYYQSTKRVVQSILDAWDASFLWIGRA